jgi:Xaa-Pro dipeptidase
MDMYRKRQQNLAALLADLEIDGLALNAGPSLTYLSGLHFHLSERPVVLLLAPGQEPVIVLPELERPKLAESSCTAFAYQENPASWPPLFHQGCRSLNLSNCRVGVEPNRLRLLEYRLLQEAIGTVEFVDISEPLGCLRSIKSAAELDHMQKAVQIAETALTATLNTVRIGMTEREVASELVLQLLRHHSDPSLPFSPIVASGPHSANPHAIPTERRLSAGDLLVIDWGASAGGYVADLTRTFAVGPISETSKQVYNIVRQANAAGRSAAGPGISCSKVDAAAREVIDRAGFGQFFTHRTGHGLGMECHEPPYIRSDNKLLLEPGMTFTVEPGIYLPGDKGVRIEDDMVVTEDGAESLSSFTRELIFIGEK